MSDFFKWLSDSLNNVIGANGVFWFTILALFLTIVCFLIGMRFLNAKKAPGVIVFWIFAALFLVCTLMLAYVYILIGIRSFIAEIGLVGIICSLIILLLCIVLFIVFGVLAFQKGHKDAGKIFISLAVISVILFCLMIYFGFFY